MNFFERWVYWIKSSLSTSSIAVLVSGSPRQEFMMQKGLRQGDSMTPFLFLVVAEGLNGLLRQAVLNNDFSGVRLGANREVEVYIL